MQILCGFFYSCIFVSPVINKISIIIPTYNEIENIENIVHAVLSLHKSFDILIVDDNSPEPRPKWRLYNKRFLNGFLLKID